MQTASPDVSLFLKREIIRLKRNSLIFYTKRTKSIQIKQIAGEPYGPMSNDMK